MFCTAPDGARLYYEVFDASTPWAGEPTTIVFHHGIAMSSGLWRGWLPRLADRYRLVALDMRGYGRSTVPEPGYPWSLEGLVADLMAVADAAGATRFHFVGESIGGTVGLLAALRQPERLRSLTVSNGAPRGRLVQNLAGWSGIIAADGMRGWADRLMAWRFHPSQLDEARYRWAHAQHADCSATATLALAEVLANADITAELPAIRLPVLLLSPDASPFIPATIMADMHARLPDAELKVFPHSKHGLPLSHAAECAAALREFLDRRVPA